MDFKNYVFPIHYSTVDGMIVLKSAASYINKYMGNT